MPHNDEQDRLAMCHLRDSGNIKNVHIKSQVTMFNWNVQITVMSQIEKSVHVTCNTHIHYSHRSINSDHDQGNV